MEKNRVGLCTWRYQKTILSTLDRNVRNISMYASSITRGQRLGGGVGSSGPVTLMPTIAPVAD